MTVIEVKLEDAAGQLSSLVEAIQKNGTWVRICQDGKPVAELRPAAAVVSDPLLQSELLSRVSFRDDPTTPLEDDDWPVDLR